MLPLLDTTAGSTGVIYSAWVVLVLIAGGLSILGIMGVMSDRGAAGPPLIILLIIASFLSFISGILSANLDFINGATVTTYTGLYWMLWPMAAIGLVDALFVLIAAMSSWQSIRVSRGY